MRYADDVAIRIADLSEAALREPGRAAADLFDALAELRRAAISQGTPRRGITTGDLNHVFSMLHSVAGADRERIFLLRTRYARICMAGLVPSSDGGTLPGPAPTSADVTDGSMSHPRSP